MEDHKTIFKKIYDENIWGGSGGGSAPSNCIAWVEFIKVFIKKADIKTVIDFGCGDWQHSHLIGYDKLGVKYMGVDVVESVIAANKIKFESKTTKFECLDSYTHLTGTADLLIIKDVLMHWKNEDIIEFLRAQMGKHQYIILCNIINDGIRVDSKDPSTHPQGLSVNHFPLNLFQVSNYFEDNTNPNDKKEIVVIRK